MLLDEELLKADGCTDDEILRILDHLHKATEEGFLDDSCAILFSRDTNRQPSLVIAEVAKAHEQIRPGCWFVHLIDAEKVWQPRQPFVPRAKASRAIESGFDFFYSENYRKDPPSPDSCWYCKRRWDECNAVLLSQPTRGSESLRAPMAVVPLERHFLMIGQAAAGLPQFITLCIECLNPYANTFGVLLREYVPTRSPRVVPSSEAQGPASSHLPDALAYYRWWRKQHPLPGGWTGHLTPSMRRGAETFDLFLTSDRYYMEIDLGQVNDPTNASGPFIIVRVVEKGRQFPADEEVIALVQKLLGTTATPDPDFSRHHALRRSYHDQPIDFDRLSAYYGSNGANLPEPDKDARHFMLELHFYYPPMANEYLPILMGEMKTSSTALRRQIVALNRLRMKSEDPNLKHDLDVVMQGIEDVEATLLKLQDLPPLA